jgi:hypothetical protein
MHAGEIDRTVALKAAMLSLTFWASIGIIYNASTWKLFLLLSHFLGLDKQAGVAG